MAGTAALPGSRRASDRSGQSPVLASLAGSRRSSGHSGHTPLSAGPPARDGRGHNVLVQMLDDSLVPFTIQASTPCTTCTSTRAEKFPFSLFRGSAQHKLTGRPSLEW